MSTTTMPRTMPMFEVEPREPDPLAVAIRRIVPGASRVQVGELEELLAREIERAARRPGKRQG